MQHIFAALLLFDQGKVADTAGCVWPYTSIWMHRSLTNWGQMSFGWLCTFGFGVTWFLAHFQNLIKAAVHHWDFKSEMSPVQYKSHGFVRHPISRVRPTHSHLLILTQCASPGRVAVESPGQCHRRGGSFVLGIYWHFVAQALICRNAENFIKHLLYDIVVGAVAKILKAHLLLPLKGSKVKVAWALSLLS